MTKPTDTLYSACESVLAAIVAHYASLATPLPGRQYVAPGLPARDCEQITVHAARTFTYAGDLVSAFQSPIVAHPAHALRAAELVVEIVRCVPTVDSNGDSVILPTVDDEQGAALAIYEDHLLIEQAVIDAERNGDLPGCSDVVIGDWTVISPEGGLGGGSQTLLVGLTGRF